MARNIQRPCRGNSESIPQHNYAKIAPAAAHAQHMPSHIFTRVG
jgi:hypothetical protein